MTEAQKNRIQKKIDRFKLELRKEKTKYKFYHDGNGYRYEIAELYFQLADSKKTNRYINWFDKNFPNDSKYSHFDLGDAVAKFETGKLKESKAKSIDLNSHNTYLIDLLIGEEIVDQNKYEWMDSESLTWAKNNLATHQKLITPNYLLWLKELRNKKDYLQFYQKLIAIKKLLKGMEVGEERTKLLKASRQCILDWKA